MPVAIDRDRGRELHDIQRNGNLILRDSFARAAGTADDRALVPPFLLFEKPGVGRDVRFRSGQRFQNYRATFTVLDESTVSRRWINQVLVGRPDVGAPRSWMRWVDGAAYDSLIAPPTTRRGDADREQYRRGVAATVRLDHERPP